MHIFCFNMSFMLGYWLTIFKEEKEKWYQALHVVVAVTPWGHPNLYLRIEGEVKSKFIFQVLNGFTASCTTKYTATYKIRDSQINNGQKVYALNTHPITFLLIYLEMKKKKCGRLSILIWNELKLQVMTEFI
jgi:uncharacterized Zn-finger protein